MLFLPLLTAFVVPVAIRAAVNASDPSTQSLNDTRCNISLAVAIDPSNSMIASSYAACQSSCGPALDSAAREALDEYNDVAPDMGVEPSSNISDPTFLSWALKNDADYISANMECQSRVSSLQGTIDNVQGDDPVRSSSQGQDQPTATTGSPTNTPSPAQQTATGKPAGGSASSGAPAPTQSGSGAVRSLGTAHVRGWMLLLGLGIAVFRTLC